MVQFVTAKAIPFRIVKDDADDTGPVHLSIADRPGNDSLKALKRKLKVAKRRGKKAHTYPTAYLVVDTTDAWPLKDAFAAYRALRAYPGRVEGILGDTGLSGAIMLQACNERFGADRGYAFNDHPVAGIAFWLPEKCPSKRTLRKAVSLLARHGGMKKRYVRKLIKHEAFLSPTEAKGAGLIDTLRRA